MEELAPRSKWIVFFLFNQEINQRTHRKLTSVSTSKQFVKNPIRISVLIIEFLVLWYDNSKILFTETKTYNWIQPKKWERKRKKSTCINIILPWANIFLSNSTSLPQKKNCVKRSERLFDRTLIGMLIKHLITHKITSCNQNTNFSTKTFVKQ